ncbi:hypothetical protein [Desertivibrio insolitus]|nr:hypothetical protein [Herbiconiux sp. SYSU D00978]
MIASRAFTAARGPADSNSASNISTDVRTDAGHPPVAADSD